MRATAAIYARFSTELQSDRSIDDQVTLCRSYAEREGLQVVGAYADRARSGGFAAGREGLSDLMEDARAGKFDVVIVEALDRLSRDMEDLAGIHKRLTFQGVQIRAVHEGAVNTVLVGLRGLMGQMFREDTAHKIRRGLEARAKAGLSAGGKAYGYEPVPGEPGKRRIVEADAAIVRRICENYAAGATPREIAGALNRESIPSPSGGKWNASTINGSAGRGNGILHNQIYAGRLVWNRVRMIWDPDTGKRLSRNNAADRQTVADAPELRIVPEELWQKVQRRVAENGGSRSWERRRPTRPLSGLLRCGACGAGMSSKGADKTGRTRIQCSGYKERGDCPDPATFYLDSIESATLDRLQQEMRNPALITEYARTYHEERRRLAAEAIGRRADVERRLAAVEKEADRITDWLVKGIGDADRLDRRAKQLMEEERELRGQLADMAGPPNVVTLHPQALARFEQQLEQLSQALGRAIDLGVQEAADGIRELVRSVTVGRDEEGGLSIEIEGRLNALLGPGPLSRRVGGMVVAEEGLEPPTPGL